MTLSAAGRSSGDLHELHLPQFRHDIRNYLNQIVGYSELILQSAEDDGDEQLAALQQVRGIANSMLATTDALAELCPGPEALDLVQRLVSKSDEVLAFLEECFLSDVVRLGVKADLERVRQAAASLRGLCAMLISSSSTHPAALAATPVPASPQPVTIESPAPRPALSSPAKQGSAEISSRGVVLVVDDNEGNRELLSRRLATEGYSVLEAVNGTSALAMLSRGSIDLVLLDVMMPDINGREVLERMKGDSALRDIPVIMISGNSEISISSRCIEVGAEDYLSKPFDPVLLRARINSSLERKRLRDEERVRTQQLERALTMLEEQKRTSDNLLRNILPARVAKELQERGAVDPMYFEDATICFTDFVGFMKSTEELSAEELVYILNDYFTGFDTIIAKYGLEKLKTVGDSYMFAAGLPEHCSSHPVDAVLAAFDLVDFVKAKALSETSVKWRVRVGIHTGPVIAGVVGIHKFAFDVWGESVNLSARMESCGAPDRINISERTYVRIKDFFQCEPRGKVPIKDGREFDMYFVDAITPKLRANISSTAPSAFGRRYRIYFQKELNGFPACLMPAES